MSWFKRSTKKSPPSAMTTERARDIVYRFADILAEEAPYIGDASVLPCSRSELRKAFSAYLAWMYSEREKNSTSFETNGYGDTLRSAEQCSCRVDDFHDIQPGDKAEIARINSSVKSPTDLGDREMGMMAKYPLGGATT